MKTMPISGVIYIKISWEGAALASDYVFDGSEYGYVLQMLRYRNGQEISHEAIYFQGLEWGYDWVQW